MKQKQIQSIPGLINAGGLILGGVMDLSASVGLTFTTQSEVAQELTDLVMACGNLEQAKQVKATRRTTFVEAVDDTRSYVRDVRDVLKRVLGYEYSDRWTALLFKNTLAISTSAEDLNPQLQAIELFLTNNPTLEVPALEVTAAKAHALFVALAAAQNGLAAQDMEIEEKMNLRDAKADTMRLRIGAVIKELGLRLSPLDPRWLRFGLNMPGADETPDQVTGLKVTLIGPTAAAMKWEPSARAQYYRIWMKVHGAEGDYLSLGSPGDLDFTAENLPANATIDIVVTAVNNGGESPVSEVITITTH